MDEHISVDEGKCIALRNRIIHNDYKGLTAWVDKHNNYSNREIMNLISNDEDVDLKSLSFSTRVRRFVKNNIKGGILDGKEGRTFAFLQAYWYRYLVDAKMYEYKINNSKKK